MDGGRWTVDDGRLRMENREWGMGHGNGMLAVNPLLGGAGVGSVSRNPSSIVHRLSSVVV
jgi:hypothetical protein